MIVDIAEIRAQLATLKAEVGSKAEVSFTVGLDSHSAYVYLAPEGILGKRRLIEHGNSFEECFEKVTTRWRECAESCRAETVKKMALAIIRLTAELGECSDAALRAEFDSTEVSRYGQEACELANKMAANGPFKIVATAGDNTGEN